MKPFFLSVAVLATLAAGIVTDTVKDGVPPVSTDRTTRSFTVEDLEKFRKQEIAQRKYIEDVLEADEVFTSHGVDPWASERVARAAERENLSSRLLAALIVVESSGRRNVVSKGMAYGPMQVTTLWGTKEQLMNVDDNIRIGSSVLARHVHERGVRQGLRMYFGISSDSTASDEYASKVLMAQDN